ncbi:MAG: response regulator [Steroidobacteraceae bacterium]|nr:response regulator [Steroidobacteraceae bacterium]
MPWTRLPLLSTLERRVFLVAVASILPVAIFSCVLLISNARAQKDRLLRVNEDTMFALVTAVDAELKSDIAALDALAASPRLARGDFAGLREEALELLGRRSSWLDIAVLDKDRQYMNARVAEDEALPDVLEAELIAEVLGTRRPVVGQIAYAQQLKLHTVAVVVPYLRDGEAKFAIAALISPDSFLNLLELESVRSQGVIAVVDRNHRVVARSRNHSQWIGKQPSLGLLAMLESGAMRGSLSTKTLEGVPVYTVFRRSSFSGWAGAVGISRAEVDGPVIRAYLVLGGSVLFSILLGLVAAALVGRTIVEPMIQLEESAARVGRGEAPLAPRTRLPEVQRVAVALAKAHAERAELFQREREARVAAENASKAKDEFLAMLGHELRNPLAAITNAANLVERQRHTLEPAAATATDIITRQARHLSRMTDDLLDAGRVILGKISLTRAPLDLVAAVTAAMENLRSTQRLGDHDVQAALDSVWVFADATRIDQIIGNLLTNAVKYTPAGGQIRVATRREGAQAVFMVADSGIGLEPELLPRAFELFVQGERALDRSQGGLGIGLTLVRRLAELHGGSVDAQSPGSGRGATFTLRLPAIDAPANLSHARVDSPARAAKHVALVEDNDDARLSLAMLLEFEGHTVYQAADGNAGVDLIAGEPRISIAFVDIGLPGLSGYAVAQALRARRGKSLRLVAMSGYGSDQDIAQGIEAGFDAYIVKPAEIEKVGAELAKA